MKGRERFSASDFECSVRLNNLFSLLSRLNTKEADRDLPPHAVLTSILGNSHDKTAG